MIFQYTVFAIRAVFASCFVLHEIDKRPRLMHLFTSGMPSSDSLLAQLAARLENHPVIERHYEENQDQFLIGLLGLMGTVLQQAPDLKEDALGNQNEPGLLEFVC